MIRISPIGIRPKNCFYYITDQEQRSSVMFVGFHDMQNGTTRLQFYTDPGAVFYRVEGTRAEAEALMPVLTNMLSIALELPIVEKSP